MTIKASKETTERKLNSISYSAANFLPRPSGQKPIPATGNIVPLILPISVEPNKTVFTKTGTKSVPHPPSPSKNTKTEPKTSETTTCRDHEKAGQELCYVCMQRTKANSALYSKVENKEEEQDEQFLHQYQIMNNKDTAFKDQVVLCID
ncbi:coiled-coil domain-containing protein 81-like [Erinaceus europaeus]|uniref:Coiled-coil domain-containing protein 81-like n=1 Tax=Erinaceus europaeus TaxID=9365 RepID=A0ABM3W5B3_ERIEU|nr:coiled-coil domain-containing protein 81-like [Erinaceus europaeus]